MLFIRVCAVFLPSHMGFWIFFYAKHTIHFKRPDTKNVVYSKLLLDFPYAYDCTEGKMGQCGTVALSTLISRFTVETAWQYFGSTMGRFPLVSILWSSVSCLLSFRRVKCTTFFALWAAGITGQLYAILYIRLVKCTWKSRILLCLISLFL